MNDAPANRRRFRFGLRTLLAVVTLAAVGSWAYWIGWPWWRDREYRAFLESVKSLKIGLTEDQASQLIRGIDRCTVFKTEIRASENSDTPYKPTMTASYAWNDAIFCVYYVAQGVHPGGGFSEIFSSDFPCIRIEAFRLATRPVNYVAAAPNPHRGEWRTRLQQPIPGDDFPNMTYVDDFAMFISSDHKNNPGFQYDLIYSDPPAKPEAK